MKFSLQNLIKKLLSNTVLLNSQFYRRLHPSLDPSSRATLSTHNEPNIARKSRKILQLLILNLSTIPCKGAMTA